MSPELAEARAETPVIDIPKIDNENFSQEEEEVHDTFITLNPDFEEIKDLCVDKPISCQSQHENITIEDQEDIENARKSLSEPGSISLEDLKKELEL